MYITRQKTKEILSCYSWMLAKVEFFEEHYSVVIFSEDSEETFKTKLEECEKAQDYLSEHVAE